MFSPQSFYTMRTASELKARDLKKHRKLYKLQLRRWLEPGLLEIPSSWQVGTDACALLLWASGGPVQWQASQQGISSPQQVWKSHFSGLLTIFCPWTRNPLWSWESVFFPNPPELIWKMLWNPQPDVLFCSNNNKERETEGDKCF